MASTDDNLTTHHDPEAAERNRRNCITAISETMTWNSAVPPQVYADSRSK